MGLFSKLQRSKSLLHALPRFSSSPPTPAAPSSLRQGPSFFTRCGRPNLHVASPCELPSLSVQRRSFYGCHVETAPPPPGWQKFQAGRNRSIAVRVVQVIKHEQVRDMTKTKHERYDLSCFGISNGGTCKMQVWRNLDHRSSSWTVRLEGPGWRASVLDCPDLSAVSLAGGKIAVCPESLHFGQTGVETATLAASENGHTMAGHEAELLVQDLCLVIDRIQRVEQRCGTGFFSSIMRPKMEMSMEDHCLVSRPRMLPVYLVITLFCSTLAILFACLYHFGGRRLKQIASEYSYVPSLGHECRASPSSSLIYGNEVEIPGLQPFQVVRTRPMAKHLINVIKRKQVRDTTEVKHDRYSLGCFGISNGRSFEMQVWRNLDDGSPSWTVHLEGTHWRAFMLDCPDLSAGCLPVEKIAVSPESPNFRDTDAKTATFTANEVGQTMASREAEMLLQNLCAAIFYIQYVEQYWETGFISSVLPKREMIIKDHRLVLRLPIPSRNVVFCLLAAIAFSYL